MSESNSKIQSHYQIDESLHFVFENVESGVLIENINRLIEFANDPFCKLFSIKFPPHQLKHSSILDNVSSFSMLFENSLDFKKSIQEIPTKAIAIRDEKWRLRNGKVIIRDYAPLYKDEELRGHIWIYREHKPVHSLHITNTNTIIENALHLLPGEIAIFNPEAQIVYANKAYINSDEKRLWAKNKTLSQYFSYANLSNEIAKTRTDNILKVVSTGKSVAWEEITMLPEKTSQYHLRVCYPVIGMNGDLESIIENSVNITQKVELEAKLKQATDYMFTTLNNLNDFVLQTDGELKLQFINKAWENMTGQQFKDYDGKSIFEILSITRYELYEKMFAILAGDASQKTGLLSIKGKDGKDKKLQYNLQPAFNVNASKIGVLATLSDVTGKHLQEAQLIELVKREKELNELKTAFVNMVSHELRTPLTVISSSAEILELMIQAGKGYDDVSIYTKQIIDEVEKMTAFMQDLLMVSKIEAGRIEINPRQTDVVEFVNNVINNGFNPWKDGRRASLKVKRSPIQAAIDNQLLQHALQNLLQNAFKYSSGKDNVKVRIAFSNTYYTISVIDNGIGIPKDEIEKLFSSFFRATNTGNISGTGIGLIVAKYFTEQHKGFISVRSRINKGSIFTIKLPYNQ